MLISERIPDFITLQSAKIAQQPDMHDKVVAILLSGLHQSGQCARAQKTTAVFGTLFLNLSGLHRTVSQGYNLPSIAFENMETTAATGAVLGLDGKINIGQRALFTGYDAQHLGAGPACLACMPAKPLQRLLRPPFSPRFSRLYRSLI